MKRNSEELRTHFGWRQGCLKREMRVAGYFEKDKRGRPLNWLALNFLFFLGYF